MKIDRDAGTATLTLAGPAEEPPADLAALHAAGAASWTLAMAREFDDALLHLRFNEPEIGVLIFRSQGDPAKVAAHEALLLQNPDDWLAAEILHYWKRVLKRIDLTSRSLVALIEHGSVLRRDLLAEIAFAVDRSYMMEDEFDGDNRPLATHHSDRRQFRPLSQCRTA